MSIWIEGHWPSDRHSFPDEDEFENDQRNQQELKDPVLDAIEGSISDAHGDDMSRMLSARIALIPRCPISSVDAYGIALQCIEDIGNYDFDHDTYTIRDAGWEGYESNAEGFDNHSLYHAARPYECGPTLPGPDRVRPRNLDQRPPVYG